MKLYITHKYWNLILSLQEGSHFSKMWYYCRAGSVTQVAFKNYTPIIKCITKTDGTTIDDSEELILVILVNFGYDNPG